MSTPSLFQRAKDLFVQAIEMPAEERRPWLRELARRDAAAAAEVNRLLAHAAAATEQFAPVIRQVEEKTRLTDTTPRFQPGELIADRYRIDSRLGGGGMGEVFRAYDELLQESVALKFWHLPPGGFDQSEADRARRLQRLVTEAQIARRIEHAHVCRVFDVGIHSGPMGEEPFLSLELISGSDLGHHLRNHGPMDSQSLRRLALQLCGALAAIHQRRILHRDLKPANVLLDAEGRARLTDFGIATDGVRETTAPHAGTPGYMAPEIENSAEPSPASDLFSLAVVLLEAATGESRQIGGLKRPALNALEDLNLDPVVKRIIELCLAEDPCRRPASAALLRDALSQDDDLEAMLILGEPLSPTVIAGSRSTAVLDGRGARRLVILCCLGWVALWMLSAQVESSAVSGLDRPGAERARQARQLADQILPDRDLKYQVWGYTEIEGERYPGIPYPRGVETAGRDVYFWYRESSAPLTNWNVVDLMVNGGRVHMLEPAIASLNTLTLGFDADGRLFLFAYYPFTLEPPTTGAERAWEVLYEAAGIDLESLQPGALSAVVPSAADLRWTLRAKEPESELYVDLGSLRGQPVLLNAMDQADVDPEWFNRSTLGRQYQIVVTPVFIAWVLFFAWRHWRNGLGDPWGARRLAAFVSISAYLSFLLQADHSHDLGEEPLFLAAGLAGPMLYALVAWALYMGCEPWIRRLWPRALVSWNRLLRGRRAVRDPAVSSHLLLGIGLGIFFSLMHLLGRAASAWIQGLPLPLAAPLPAGLPALRHGLGALFQAPPSGIAEALLFVVALAWGRRLVPIPWLGAGLAVGLLTFGTLMAAPEPWSALVFYGLMQVALGCWIAARHGLLILVTALTCTELLRRLPPFPEPAVPWASPLSLGLLLWLIAWCGWNLRHLSAAADGR